MNLTLLQMLVLSLAIIFVVLLPISRGGAWLFGRYTILLFASALMLAPFLWLICAAFKDNDFLLKYTFLPSIDDILHNHAINLSNYRELFTARDSVQGPVGFWRYLFNSLYLASALTFLSMVFSSMGGYAMAKYQFRGRGVLLTFMLASMAIPSLVLVSPNFIVVWQLGWMDSFKAIVIPTCVSVFGIFLFRQAIVSVPNDLIEAGRIDGCSEFRIYFSLVMPLVRPMTGAFCLITFLGAWNSFFIPNVFLQTQSHLTLPVALNQYVGIYAAQYGVFLAGTLLAIIPPAVLFLALQKEFIAGLTSGAVKQ